MFIIYPSCLFICLRNYKAATAFDSFIYGTWASLSLFNFFLNSVFIFLFFFLFLFILFVLFIVLFSLWLRRCGCSIFDKIVDLFLYFFIGFVLSFFFLIIFVVVFIFLHRSRWRFEHSTKLRFSTGDFRERDWIDLLSLWFLFSKWQSRLKSWFVTLIHQEVWLLKEMLFDRLEVLVVILVGAILEGIFLVSCQWMCVWHFLCLSFVVKHALVFIGRFWRSKDGRHRLYNERNVLFYGSGPISIILLHFFCHFGAFIFLLWTNKLRIFDNCRLWKHCIRSIYCCWLNFIIKLALKIRDLYIFDYLGLW